MSVHDNEINFEISLKLTLSKQFITVSQRHIILTDHLLSTSTIKYKHSLGPWMLYYSKT
jgi:hypothetical protein